jgi:hypothetical protein
MSSVFGVAGVQLQSHAKHPLLSINQLLCYYLPNCLLSVNFIIHVILMDLVYYLKLEGVKATFLVALFTSLNFI